MDKRVKNMLNQDITHLAPVANAVKTPGMFDVSTSTARRKLEIGELFDKCQGRYSAAIQTHNGVRPKYRVKIPNFFRNSEFLKIVKLHHF